MTKYRVLTILKKNNDYVSGETISRELGLSRAAINLAIKALKQEGYDIMSSTKKGYLLINDPDLINEGELTYLLGEERIKQITLLQEVDSTNSYLKLKANEANEGQVVIANKQTKGRGRLGRSFISPENEGLYLSYLLKPNSMINEVSSITAWAAIAVNNAIEKVYGIRPGIKWVNDLVLNKKKICGILSEMAIESENSHIQYVIIGIGININQIQFEPSIANIASSLFLETNKRIKRSLLASKLIEELDILTRKWPNDKEEYYQKYVLDNITVGKEIKVIRGDETFEAFASKIDDSFGLVIQYEEKEETVRSGEISVRGIYDYV